MAGRSAIHTLILRQGLLLAGGGITIGMAGAFGSTQLLGSLVYDVSTLDQ